MSGLIDILKLPAKARNIELNEKVISAAGITPILIKMRNDDLIRLLKEKSKPHHFFLRQERNVNLFTNLLQF